jgi:hypothetical protein
MTDIRQVLFINGPPILREVVQITLCQTYGSVQQRANQIFVPPAVWKLQKTPTGISQGGGRGSEFEAELPRTFALGSGSGSSPAPRAAGLGKSSIFIALDLGFDEGDLADRRGADICRPKGARSGAMPLLALVTRTMYLLRVSTTDQ